jgi:hypothetical protein
MENEKKLDRKTNIMVNGKSLGKTETVNTQIHRKTHRYRPVWASIFPVELKSGQEKIHSSNLFPRSLQS